MALALYSVIYTALATTGLVLLRRSLADAGLSSVVTDPQFLAGGLFYAASFATFLLSLRRFEVLTVYPVFSGLVYASLTIAAAAFLHESLTSTRLVGIVLVAGGVALLVR
jgi:multidrug transporter EmrE-like cation transporter